MAPEVDRILIVGAGGLGREMAGYLLADPRCGYEWTVAGFLDDDPDKLRETPSPLSIVGSIAGYETAEGERLICALGQPKTKRLVVTMLQERGAVFAPYIHPSVVIGPEVHLGKGCVLCPGVVLTCNIRLGDFAMLNLHATIGHDASVGDFSTLSSHCDLTGAARVGNDVFFGSSAAVLPGKTVGDGAIVGAGAVVVRNVRAGQTVVGNPAKPL